MKYEPKRYEFILRAQTPIAHAQETFGNTSLIMRRSIRLPDGSWADVPIITGDTMRHGLREAAAYAVLDGAGLLDKASLSEAALRLLFAGGMVTGKGDGNTVKLDAYREMVELVPPLALLGGCAMNRVIPGRLNVEDAILICDETMHYMPEWVHEWMQKEGGETGAARSHVEEVQRVRMDPTLNPSKCLLLTEGEQVRVAGRLVAHEGASESGDAIVKQDTKSSMLPRRHECVKAGSLFYWSASAVCLSDLDVDTFHTMMAAFLANATVGGKRATGHGRIVAVTARNIAIRRPRETPQTFELAAPEHRVGRIFEAHMKDRAERVKDFLATVDA